MTLLTVHVDSVMFEKVSEPGQFLAGLRGVGFKNPKLKRARWTENAAEGCLFEEDNFRRGAEEFRPRAKRPTLIFSRRRSDVQAHP
jgi:hypothetical protein